MPKNNAESYAKSVGEDGQNRGEYREGGEASIEEKAKSGGVSPAHTPVMAQCVYLRKLGVGRSNLR